MLRGRFVVLQFNDDGVVTQRTLLGEETKVLEMRPLPGMRCCRSMLAA